MFARILCLLSIIALCGFAPLDYRIYAPEAKRIVERMTLEEKIGQMTLPSIDMIYHDGGLSVIRQDKLGAVLAEGDTVPPQGPELKNWQALAEAMKKQATFPLLLGTDAVHGNQHVANAVIFPHNIGLGAAHDPELINAIASWTAYDVEQSGFNWIFAPTVAAAHDYRWGRTYESFASDPALIKQYANAYVQGAQLIANNRITGALTSTKHFIGDGNTDAGIDEGNDTVLNDEQFLKDNYPGYIGAFEASTGNVMVSYSSINGLPMSINKKMLQKYLLPYFSGFVVSDYGAIEKAAIKVKRPYAKVLADAINSGIDMIMLTNEFPQLYTSIAQFQQILLKDVENGLISKRRIDEAVVNIIQVKLAMGLLDKNNLPMSKPPGDENQIALQAAEESLVLLKNNRVLPVDPNKLKQVILLGDAVDDIGSQCGGWRIVWQGKKGNQYTDNRATSILMGIRNNVGNKVNIIVNDLPASYTHHDTIAIVVLAEFPYAEYLGDVGNNNPLYNHIRNPYAPTFEPKDLVVHYDKTIEKRIQQLKAAGVPVITVLLSGRPMVISAGATSPLRLSSAFIAAWLPGTTGGQAIANAIFGQYHFRQISQTNTLTFAWPASMQQVGQLFCARSGKKPKPLFDCGFGLSD